MLSRFGPHLWTREVANRIREEVVLSLQNLSPGDVLVLDAKGVEVFDFSFANELFGKLILGIQHDFPGRFVIVENLSTYTNENLQKALEALGVAMALRKGKKISLVGKVHPSDESTFSAIYKKFDGVTASQLAEQLEVNLNAMNERLSKLLSLGLVRRDKATSTAGRVQYEYRSLR